MKTVIQRKTFDISWTAIAKILITIGAIYLGVKLLGVIIFLFFAFSIASGVMPIVRYLQSKRVPRGLSILSAYLTIAFGVSAVLLIMVTPFLSELSSLKNEFPLLLDNMIQKVAIIAEDLPYVDMSREQFKSEALNFLRAQSADIFGGGVGALTRTIDGASLIGFVAGSVLYAVIFSIYIVTDHDNLLNTLLGSIKHPEKKELVKCLVEDVENQLGRWLVGQLSLSIIIGIVTYLLLTVLGIPFALPLAVLAGALEAIPNIGPVVSAIPAIIIAVFTQDPWIAVLVALGYLIIQQLENNLIVPKVMSDAVGLPSIAVIIGVLVGYTLLGVAGALLAVPVTVVLKLAFQFYRDLQNLKAKGMV